MIASSPIGFILNPGANRNRAVRQANALQKQINELWPGSELYITGNKDDIAEMARSAASKFGKIVACGGDGTINQVLEIAAETKCIAGIVPLGSGNDFIKTPGISRNPIKALEQLHTGVERKVDIIRYIAHCEHGVVSGIAMNSVGLGFDGRTNYEASQLKVVKGPLLYFFAALKSAFASIPSEFMVNLDGDRHVDDYLMFTFANGRVEGGNFKIAPNASLFDGHVDVIMVPPVSKFTLFTRLPLFLIGKQHWTSIVKTTTCKRSTLELAIPLPAHVDGEQIGLEVSKIELFVDEGAVSLICPRRVPD